MKFFRKLFRKPKLDLAQVVIEGIERELEAEAEEAEFSRTTLLEAHTMRVRYIGYICGVALYVWAGRTQDEVDLVLRALMGRGRRL